MPRKPRYLYDGRQYALLFNQQGKLLLLRVPHRFEHISKCWTLPGGRLEPDDSPESGILREIEEETQLKVKSLRIKHVARWNTERSEKLAIFYVCELDDTKEDPILSDEHSDFVWVAPHDFDQYDFYHPEYKKAVLTCLNI